MQFQNKNNDSEEFVSFPFYILTLTYHNYIFHITSYNDIDDLRQYQQPKL
jgi:hypothetical protein